VTPMLLQTVTKGKPGTGRKT